MKKLLIIISLNLFINSVSAQLDLNKLNRNVLKGMELGNLNMGSILSDLEKGIKPSMLDKSWTKKAANWSKYVANINDVNAAAKSLSALVKNIKPQAFTTGFASLKSNWLKKLSEINDAVGFANCLKTLMGGIKPEALTGDFLKKQEQLSNALQLLK
jgi:hypothetical protein